MTKQEVTQAFNSLKNRLEGMTFHDIESEYFDFIVDGSENDYLVLSDEQSGIVVTIDCQEDGSAYINPTDVRTPSDEYGKDYEEFDLTK